MSSRHLVDPELTPILDVYQPLEPLRDTLPAIRRERAAIVHAMLASLPPDDIEKSEHLIPGPAGAPPVRVLVYKPRNAQGVLPVFLNIHGGGLVGGMPEQDEPANRRIAASLGCLVLAPAYRLAPEHPFPAALDDCRTTLEWLVAHAAALGVDPTRIALGGSSAGGGLAAALALQLRDTSPIQLAFLYLVFPMLDDRTGSTVEPSPYAGEFIWTAAQNHFGWSCYLGPHASAPPLYAVPARAESLANLPPTWLCCGALDLFIDENLDFTRRLIFTLPRARSSGSHRAGDTGRSRLPSLRGLGHAFQWVPIRPNPLQVTQKPSAVRPTASAPCIAGCTSTTHRSREQVRSEQARKLCLAQGDLSVLQSSLRQHSSKLQHA